jgi:hypothetical protein
MRTARNTGLVGLLLAAGAMAQTYTDCNPTEKSCPSDAGLDQYTYNVDFTQGESPDWTMTYGTASYDSNGVGFSISKSGEAPTMQSNFYMFFGQITAMVRAAPGTGIVSCVILESDCLDEIDWEWLGGDVNQVQTNYFGKGNTTTYDRGTYVAVPDGTQDIAHNYTLVWTEEATIWYINGAEVRRLNYGDALGGQNYPQTPMRIKLGNWIAADTGSEGTIQWAGGRPDYSQAPFSMYIESIEIVNYNPASTYTYGDTSGAWESIQMDNGTSTTTTTDSKNTRTESSISKDGDNQILNANDTMTTVTAPPPASTRTAASGTSSSTSDSAAATTSAANPGQTTVPSGDDGSFAVRAAPATGALLALVSFAMFFI